MTEQNLKRFLVKPSRIIQSKSTGKGRVISLPNLDTSVLEVQTDLGVDNIKAAFKTILEIGEDFVTLAQDFSIQAAIPIAFKLANFQTYIATFKQALAEFKDGISPLEAQEIGNDLKINFDIENNNLEETIEKIIDLMPTTYLYVLDGIELYLKWRVTVVDLKELFKKDEIIAP